MTEQVTFWFDVACPFCWQTSRWMKEVEKVRDVNVEWVPMSLAVLNDGADIPADYAKAMEANWGPARVFAKVKAEAPEKIDELYTAMGTLVHPGGEGGKKGYGAYDEIIAKALEEVGLDASYADVANTDDYDEKLRGYHQGAMDAVGDEVGTPVLKLGDTAFFGPVITRVPEGEEAGKLFDHAVGLAEFPYFFELKRSRTEAPQV
ncbi:Predicted dithiol-disulfide isomerase, DsbA family [Corynebacterium appendicis CIP 107643]|uniref:Predicted dithiol-disulfide isomerase, DsbA family n=1 Tax=Corynebacterium appendicis CIP 107643 TaxID=1161099 RepID=A0A1N7JPX6_9CORY|nr:DsbA family protein [Corynebacterium appendicis]WJY61715.1 DSBA-like thioredoxin domain protein [Corynebacterium appendicis CIP 107643]SIS51296.1 Predicted dithiol-disulfide isomerase, DsbA family [Corynebacterium appendicis CIP 107643]